jgi:hypothetical protein
MILSKSGIVARPAREGAAHAAADPGHFIDLALQGVAQIL